MRWQTVAVTTDLKLTSGQRLNIKLFNILGDRNSVGFLPSAGITVADEINQSIGEYSSRTVDIDQYRNYGMEARYLLGYQKGRLGHNLSAGMRLYSGTTLRYRGGKGTPEASYETTLQDGTSWTGDIDYGSKNAAFFAENLFSISDKFIVVPGIRYEYLFAKASGYSSVSNGNPVYLQNQERGRGFLIGGFGMEYSISKTSKLYANATQSYRPVQFADLTTPPTTDVIDPDLTDAKGVNIDLGYRGNLEGYLVFDVSAFHLIYDNRVGTIKQQRVDGSFYNYKTNVGSSASSGIEAFGELNITKATSNSARLGELSMFVSYGYNDARYNNFQVISVVDNALSETNYKGKKVEYAPEHILRAGLTYEFKGFSSSIQYSYTDQLFTDANNTQAPSANGQNGLIPAYAIVDITIGYNHKSGLLVKAGVNNLADKNYFTRRAGGYPGPGVLPADGRTFFATLGYRMK